MKTENSDMHQNLKIIRHLNTETCTTSLNVTEILPHHLQSAWHLGVQDQGFGAHSSGMVVLVGSGSCLLWAGDL
jgi:hypothetical protein